MATQGYKKPDKFTAPISAGTQTTSQKSVDNAIGRFSPQAVGELQEHCRRILELHKRQVEFRNKATDIDTAHYRYQTTSEKKDGDVNCGVTSDNLLIPLVISQVDSFVGYAAETFLSGFPIFPVVSTPKTIEMSDQLESIIDTHAVIGQYARELLKAFRNGYKYNFMPIATDWTFIEQYDVMANYLNPTEVANLKKNERGYTSIKSLDPYNTIWDYSCSPAQCSIDGEFSGYIERYNRIKTKKMLQYLWDNKIGYNHSSVANLASANNINMYYFPPPQVSDYITRKTTQSTETDWDMYHGDVIAKSQLKKGNYEWAILNVMIIPDEFGLSVINKDRPQLFRCWMLNGTLLVGAKRLLTVQNRHPIEIGMPLEDNFELQTPSVAEATAGFQAAASTLWQVSLSGSRRSIMDRAIFDADAIRSIDVNNDHPTAKIPARLTGLKDKKLSDLYHPIPYDSRGVDAAIQNIARIMEYADMASGQNKPFRGQFQKGNKSVEEWRDTTGNADQRMRLTTLNMEMQLFLPIKETIKFNIFQNGVLGSFTNFRTGETKDIKAQDLENLRNAALNFQVADGYTPKSKIASTDFISTLLQMILQSPLLQQIYGVMVPQIIAHLASLAGVRGLNQYAPEVQVSGQPTAGQPGLPTAKGQLPAPGAGQAPPEGVAQTART